MNNCIEQIQSNVLTKLKFYEHYICNKCKILNFMIEYELWTVSYKVYKVISVLERIDHIKEKNST